MYKKKFKRLFDFIVALLIALLFCWLFLLLYVLIKITSRGPAIFKQKRVGQNKNLFYIYKFRTMRIDTPDVPTHLLHDSDSYITLVGKVLRKTSLDELPQIFNIIKGDMSIIGPRPALWNQYDLINEREKHQANSVKPGLTGLAQISGRDELSIVDKAKLDGEYVKQIGMVKDIIIFFKTFLSVLKADGIEEGKKK